jgi:beta-alanine--pyruvate transaminase
MSAPLSAPHGLANERDPFWMPFTPMRGFRQDPLLFESAEGVHYVTPDGRRVLDGMAGLWCVNAGHGQPRIVEAIRAAAGTLDFVSSFKMSHPAAKAYARRLCDFAPEGIDHVFFVNSGSEAVDTALKIARGYHHARGQGGRTKLIGRAKGYHGMGFGGLSVSGIGRHKAAFGPLLEAAHLPLPYERDSMAFSQAQPEANEAASAALETLLQIHDPATVAAVIVEPVTGSGGVYPPPQGYLERLRSICDKHGILLIFDEVITGFGRLGTPFASQFYGVTPDLITCAKGMTNGAVPMGGVLLSGAVHDAFMAGPPEAIELLHGYTYSAHPLACAAGLATLDVFAEQGILARATENLPHWQAAAFSLREQPFVIDIRVAGWLCAIDLKPRAGADGQRGALCARLCLEAGLLLRNVGDTLILSPPLVMQPDTVSGLFETIAKAMVRID